MHKIFSILLILSASLIGSEDAGSLNVGMKKCTSLIQSNDIQAAMNEIRKSINCSYFDKIPPNIELLYGLKELANKENDKIRKSAYLVVCAVGYIGFNSKDGFGHALELLNSAELVNGKLPEIFNTRGILKIIAADIEGGISDYNKAIELNPNYIDAWENRSRAYLAANRPELAVRDQAVAQDLKNSIYYAK